MTQIPNSWITGSHILPTLKLEKSDVPVVLSPVAYKTVSTLPLTFRVGPVTERDLLTAAGGLIEL